MPLSVSLIVPVRDGGVVFGRCLDAMAALDPPPDEWIVVDDGSRDGSGPRAADRGARVLRLAESRGPAGARNAGARAARGDVLLFLDADVAPSPDVVGRARRALESSDLAAVIGSYDDRPADPGRVSRYRNLLHHWVHQTSGSRPGTFWGACGAVRRDAFEAVGGFDETYGEPSIEDIELGGRLEENGYTIGLDPDLRIRHHKRWTLASMIHTDVLRRAVPWTELMLSRGRMPSTLNVSPRHRWATLASLTAATALPFMGRSRVARAAALAGAGSLFALNRDFYRLLHRRGGLAFAAFGFALHGLYYLYGGLGFALGLLRHLTGLGARR